MAEVPNTAPHVFNGDVLPLAEAHCPICGTLSQARTTDPATGAMDDTCLNGHRYRSFTATSVAMTDENPPLKAIHPRLLNKAGA